MLRASLAALTLLATSFTASVAVSSTAAPRAATPPAATPPAADEEAPPIFDTRPYAEAKKAAEADHRWFIAKATAVWCIPCKRMDKTTWRDPKVVEWLQKNAIAVAFDVDKEAALARSLSISAMPTMIAFKDGKEFDRLVGSRDPAEFLAWLEAIARGETSTAILRRAAEPAEGGAKPGRVDVRAKMQLAASLANKGKFDEAAIEYAWIWQHALEHDPALYGVRLSFTASEMQDLSDRSPSARKTFRDLRDAATAAATAAPPRGSDDAGLNDWIVLNRIVHDEPATLAWFDRVKSDPTWRETLARPTLALDDLLVSEKRWRDLKYLFISPQQVLEQERTIRRADATMPPHADPEMALLDRQVGLRLFAERSSRVYAALLADGKDSEASAFAAKAREMEPDPRMTIALIRMAVEAGFPRQEQLAWLDSAEKVQKTAEGGGKAPAGKGEGAPGTKEAPGKGGAGKRGDAIARALQEEEITSAVFADLRAKLKDALAKQAPK